MIWVLLAWWAIGIPALTFAYTRFFPAGDAFFKGAQERIGAGIGQLMTSVERLPRPLRGILGNLLGLLVILLWLAGIVAALSLVVLVLGLPVFLNRALGYPFWGQ